jgi:uncharacterized protein involved in exopolysaccharide biosynthesis
MDMARSKDNVTSNPGARSDTAPGELNLIEIATILWRSKLLIIAISLVCGIAAAATAFAMPNKYEASVLMSVVTEDATSRGLGSLNSMVSQLGGLASLAGLSTSSSSNKAVPQATLQSEALTERYIKEHDLLPILYPKLWDPAKRVWRTDNPEKMPTLWKANEMFKKRIRSVNENSKTGLLTLTITWTDAHLAAQWANDLVRLTNGYLRDKAIAESERNIAYLEDQASHTNVVVLQQSIYALAESEIEKAMVARGNEEYALKVIDSATVPEKHSSPQRLLIILGSVLFGGLLSAVIVLIRHYQAV